MIVTVWPIREMLQVLLLEIDSVSCDQQVIQTITAVDKDDFANGQRFAFALPSQLPVNPNFTLKDNEGN